MTAKLCDDTRTHGLYTLKGQILWYVNDISTKLLKMQLATHSRGFKEKYNVVFFIA